MVLFKILLSLLVSCILFINCSKPVKENNEESSRGFSVERETESQLIVPNENELDKVDDSIPELLPLPTMVPTDIARYLKNLELQGVTGLHLRYLDDNEEEQIKKAISSLQDYATGKRKYYPVDDVRLCLNILSAFAHYNSGHNSDDYVSIREAENYLNQFAAIASLLCPRLDYLSTVKDAGETIGLLQFKDWSNTGSFKTYVLIPHNKGLNIQVLDELNDVLVNKIFKLNDEQGRTYYLFSNNENTMKFGQGLCLYDNGRIEYITSLDVEDVYMYRPEQENTILFNPRDLEWNFCYESNGQLHKIPRTYYLKLLLNGKKSQFRIRKLN